MAVSQSPGMQSGTARSQERPAGAESSPVRIQLTESAVEAIREMLEEEDLVEEGGLRISAHFGAGCSTPLRYDMVLEVGPAGDDLVLAAEGIRIFIDPRSAWSLDGLKVDYVDDPGVGAGFAFQHPGGKRGRVC